MKIKHKSLPFPSTDNMVYLVENHPVFSTCGGRGGFKLQKPRPPGVDSDRELHRRGHNSGNRMTNVKIQMTNQIQLFKCLNDSVKNPDQRPGLLLPSAGKAGLFEENNFSPESCSPKESQSRFNLGTPCSNPFGHPVSCKARGIPVY